MGEDQTAVGAGDPLAQLAPSQRDDLARIIAGLELEGALQARADANPLPGPLLAAFDPEPVRLGGITVRPMVAFDFIVLRKLESPLLKRAVELFKPPEQRQPVDFSDAEEADMLHQFTAPITAIRAEISAGLEHFRTRAIKLLEPGGLSALLRPQLIRAIETEFARSWCTVIAYRPGTTNDGETKWTAPGGADDGLGWWLLYVAGLARDLPWEHVLYQLPVAQGRALLNAWKETDPWLDVERDSAGYLAQEIGLLKQSTT